MDDDLRDFIVLILFPFCTQYNSQVSVITKRLAVFLVNRHLFARCAVRWEIISRRVTQTHCVFATSREDRFSQQSVRLVCSNNYTCVSVPYTQCVSQRVAVSFMTPTAGWHKLSQLFWSPTPWPLSPPQYTCLVQTYVTVTSSLLGTRVTEVRLINNKETRSGVKRAVSDIWVRTEIIGKCYE